jgi:hypothetical protein
VGQEEVPVQALPPSRPKPSRPTPLTPSPLVPLQQTPPGAEDLSATDAPERPALPAPRADMRPYGLPGARTRVAQADAVVFTAPCPACGYDCDWTEQREDTRLRASVSCSCS